MAEATDIVVMIDQRCGNNNNGNILSTCDDRRELVYNIYEATFTVGVTTTALVTLECSNPMSHFDFISSLNNNKQAMLDFIDNEFAICDMLPNDNCVTSCGVGIDAAFNCFENNGSPNNRKVLLFISFCECEEQGTDSICNRKTAFEALGIEVIVVNIDVSSDNAICVDSNDNTISSNNGITDTVTNQIINSVCGYDIVTPQPTQQQQTGKCFKFVRKGGGGGIREQNEGGGGEWGQNGKEMSIGAK